MSFFKYKIYLPGGIGCQILHLLIGLEKALKKNISPKNIEIFIVKYQNSQIDRVFHNAEDIINYLDFNKEIKIKTTLAKPKKKFKLDEESAKKIVFSLSNDYKKFFRLQDFNYSFNAKYNNTFWIRGLDRKFNIKIFENYARGVSFNKDLGVVSNDIKVLQKSSYLFSKKTGGTSLLNFECLLKTSNIISQFSGFSLAPFLLSAKRQKFFLLDKNLHSKSEFPEIENDWNFIKTLLIGISKYNKKKSYEIIT